MDQKKNNSEISAAIKIACKTSFGVLDSAFLCQSLGVLSLNDAVTVQETDTLYDVIGILQNNKIGCVIVLDSKQTISGIFSERDCVLKILPNEIDFKKVNVSEYMTKEPVTATPEVTIAYALNLMSQGGFRHLPVVDETNMPVSMISAKDVIDYIVESFTKDLLEFQPEL